MPRIPILEHDDASSNVKAVYEDFRGRMGFPAAPNFIKSQGHSDSVVKGTWDLVRNVLVTGRLPRQVKEMMFVAISHDRSCRYCEAAHIACCRMLGVDQKLLDTLVYGIETMHDHKARQIILFGLKCSRNPQSLTEDDSTGLKQQGLLEADIVEVIAMSGLAVYANIIADAIGIEPDKMFDEISSRSQ